MHPAKDERLNPGDLVVLRRRSTYSGVCRASSTFVEISRSDICIWLGKDEAMVGKQSYPRVIHAGHVIEVADGELFQRIE